MKRSRLRLLSMVLVTALMVSLVPAQALGGMLSADGALSPAGSVMATVLARAVNLTVSFDEARYSGFNLYRSEDAGSAGGKLNGEPVNGSTYRDSAVTAGATYHYTVELIERDGDGMHMLEPVSAGPLPVIAQSSRLAAPVQAPRRAPDAPKRAFSTDDVRAAGYPEGYTVISDADGSNEVTKSATWSKGKYYVASHVTVHPGVTLTIPAGTTVVFERMIEEGSLAQVAGIGMTVYGALIAKGTSTSRIRFVSDGTLDGDAYPGDWLGLYFESLKASELAYCDVEYAQTAVYSYRTSRPYVSYCRIAECGDTGIRLTEPVNDATTPRPRIVGNTILRSGTGIEVSGGAGYVVDPLISQNTISADYGIYLLQQEASGSIKGTLEGNAITATYNGIGILAAVDTTKTTAITTLLTGNSVRSLYGSGIQIECTNANDGTVTVDPVLTSTSVTARQGLYVGAILTSAPVVPLRSGVYARPVITGGTYVASSGWSLQVYAGGEQAGGAVASGRYTSATLLGNDDMTAISIGAYAPPASAQASPVFDRCNIRTDTGGWPLSIWSQGDVKATTTPRLTSCQVAGPSNEGVEVEARSKGMATSNPYVSGTSIESRFIALQSRAVSYDTGSCQATGTVIASKLVGGTGFFGEAQSYGSGPARSGVAITGSTVSGVSTELGPRAEVSPGWGVYSLAESGSGTATADPQVSGSTVTATRFGICADAANGGEAPLSVAPARVDPSAVKAEPVVTSSYVRSGDFGIAAYSRSFFADATQASPKVTGSTVAADEIGCYSEALVYSGEGSVKPQISKTTFTGGVGVAMTGSGEGDRMSASGSVSACNITSSNNGNYLRTDEPAGIIVSLSGPMDLSVTPSFTDVNVASTGYGSAASLEAFSEGSNAATLAPVFTRGSLKGMTGGLRAFAQGQNEADAYCAPSTMGTAIDGGSGYGVWSTARTWGPANATNKSAFVDTPVRSAYGTAIVAEALYNPLVSVLSDPPLATNDAVVRGTSATSRTKHTATADNGISLDTNSNIGDVVEKSLVENLAIDADETGVNVYSHAGDGFDQSIAESPVIRNNSIGGSMRLRSNGVRVEATSQDALWKPTVTGNYILRPGTTGIQLRCDTLGVAGEATVSGNTILDAGSQGIDLFTMEGMELFSLISVSADVTATVTKNFISRTAGDGIRIAGHPNGVVRQNRVYDPATLEFADTSLGAQRSGLPACLRWDGADYGRALVVGNMLTGSRGTAIHFSEGSAVTNYNSFGDSAGSVNRPFNYEMYESEPLVLAEPVVPYDAKYNWWSATTSSTIDPTIETPYWWSRPASETIDYSSPLKSVRPKVTYLKASKSSGKVYFTLIFDRPMDETVKTLSFGKWSPYSSYKVTGSWTKSADGYYRTFKGTRSLTGLPAGVYMYFNGAKDMPGTLIDSKSKGFKL